MVCKKCGSTNVNVQAVAHVRTKKRGCLYWLFIGWWLELFMWIFLTVPMLFLKLFGGGKKVKTKVKSHAVCQDCGYQFQV